MWRCSEINILWLTVPCGGSIQTSSFTHCTVWRFNVYRVAVQDLLNESGLIGVLVDCTSSLFLHSFIGSHVTPYRLHILRPPCLVKIINPASMSSLVAEPMVSFELHPLFFITERVRQKSPLLMPLY